MSLRIRIGRVMPAACTGEMTSDRIGTTSMPHVLDAALGQAEDDHRRYGGGIEHGIADHRGSVW